MKQLLKMLASMLVVAGILSPSVCVSCKSSEGVCIDTSTVRSLDVKRYMGRWYEIARYDHRFERGMTHATADYTLLPDGKIQVVNRGVRDGKLKETVGKAKQPDPKMCPGRLKVSFFLWFYADYYILELDEAYQYAVVGSSSDEYLWVLGRTPQLSDDVLVSLLQRIEARGYDVDNLIWVEQ